MRVFIAGATGVLGRELTRQFVARGHSVLGLARGEKGEQTLRSLGGQSCQASLFDADAMARAAEGSDVVIHAATAIPIKTRTRPQDWAMNDRIRREGTRALTTCAAKIGARVYLQQSVVWLARPADGSFFDEDSKPQPDATLVSALDAETIATEAGQRAGFKTAVLRCGFFYGPEAAHTRMFAENLLKRRMPVIGSGDAVVASIHTEDAASAFLAAAEKSRSGLWHVVDDEPVMIRDMLYYFAERFGAPKPRRVPVWLARLLAGEYAVKMFTSSTRTSNARFRRDFNWTPRFPSYRDGLEEIINIWRAEGFLKQ